MPDEPITDTQPPAGFSETEKVLAEKPVLQTAPTKKKAAVPQKKPNTVIIKILVIIAFIVIAYLVLKWTGIIDMVLQGVGLLNAITGG
ncbi:MAG: hypothetical protein KJ601_05810 [Nanoarchaeota archaeon]|nr:hypothetical protein [Nanoarchaeota archaeon]MBU1704097.1 hypothetical protein [Nanoarchaeota archaeon]